MSRGMPNKIKIGTKFGRLTLTKILPKRSAANHIVGRWRCNCGNMVDRALSRVKTGNKKSCGCLTIEAIILSRTIHGMKYTKTYTSWNAMRNRCMCPSSKDYPRYGAKGITVCDRWELFENFFADMGPRPEGTSLDRWPNPSGNYKPSNCRWATPIEQGRNRRRGLKLLKGPLGVMPVSDYAARMGISTGALYLRMQRERLMEGCSWVG